jgi:hypothetical protein
MLAARDSQRVVRLGTAFCSSKMKGIPLSAAARTTDVLV